MPGPPEARAGDELTAAFAPGAVRVHALQETDAAPPAPDRITWTGTVASLEPIPGGVRIVAEEYPEIAVDCSSSVAVGVGVHPGARLSFALSPADLSVRSPV